jgi:hypothetical protein
VIDQKRPEMVLCTKNLILAKIISSQTDSWRDSPDPDPIWGLLGVVISQQISTKAALTIRAKVASLYPQGLTDQKSQQLTVDGREKLRPFSAKGSLLRVYSCKRRENSPADTIQWRLGGNTPQNFRYWTVDTGHLWNPCSPRT